MFTLSALLIVVWWCLCHRALGGERMQPDEWNRA